MILMLLGAWPAGAQFNSSFVRKWGGNGTGNGQFNFTHAVAYSAPTDRIYVCDESNHRIQYFAMNGTFLGKWGQQGSGTADIYNPVCTAFAPNGNVYVVERDNHRIHYFTSDGAHLGMWGSHGSATGQFGRPAAAAFAPDGTIYVADRDNHRIQHFTATGAFLGAWGVNGSGDGQLNEPMGIAISAQSVIYVSDSQNRRIQYFTTNGGFVGKWGSAGNGAGQFGSASAYNTGPIALSIDRRGYVYVADPDNSRIEVFTATGGFIGSFGGYGNNNGLFYFSNGVATAPGWEVYVGDELNHQIQQLRVTIGSSTNPLITSLTVTDGVCKLQVDAIPDKGYTVKSSSNLVTWTAVTNFNIPSGLLNVADPIAPGTAGRFYRVEQP